MSAGVSLAAPLRTWAMKCWRTCSASPQAASASGSSTSGERPVRISTLPGSASSRSVSAVMPRAPPVARTTQGVELSRGTTAADDGAGTVRNTVRTPPG